jgi:subtilisin family serine protease
MTRAVFLLGRRSLLLGGAAMSASATTGCDAYNTMADRKDGWCQFDAESLIAGSQENCIPVDGTPTDLAWHLRKMRVPEAWALSCGKGCPAYGKGVVIGHIDTGVAEHEEFKIIAEGIKKEHNPYKGGGILWERGYDFIDDVHGGYDPLLTHIEYLEQIGHGTATASVIVSRGDVDFWDPSKAKYRDNKKPGDLGIDPGTGPLVCHGTTKPGRITGVAPAADLIPARAFRLAATWNLDVVTRAVRYLTEQRVDVITMALGWLFPSRALTEAIQDAINANILVLAAAGNFVPQVTFPANAGDAIAVAGLGPDDQPWCGSSTGKAVTVSAYGDKVWRAYRDEKSHRLDVIGPRFGTSFAVSMTAGVAALWLAHHGRANLIAELRKPNHQNLQSAFRAALCRTARQTADWNKYHGALGAGIVNAEALLRETKPVA